MSWKKRKSPEAIQSQQEAIPFLIVRCLGSPECLETVALPFRRHGLQDLTAYLWQKGPKWALSIVDKANPNGIMQVPLCEACCKDVYKGALYETAKKELDKLPPYRGPAAPPPKMQTPEECAYKDGDGVRCARPRLYGSLWDYCREHDEARGT